MLLHFRVTARYPGMPGSDTATPATPTTQFVRSLSVVLRLATTTFQSQISSRRLFSVSKTTSPAQAGANFPPTVAQPLCALLHTASQPGRS
eukprot:2459150-Rhodomonas_salina.1